MPYYSGAHLNQEFDTTSTYKIRNESWGESSKQIYLNDWRNNKKKTIRKASFMPRHRWPSRENVKNGPNADEVVREGNRKGKQGSVHLGFLKTH